MLYNYRLMQGFYEYSIRVIYEGLESVVLGCRSECLRYSYHAVHDTITAMTSATALG